MTQSNRDRLITALVVFAGIAALGVANKLGADKDVLTAASGVLLVIAGSLKSMLVGDGKEESK